MSDKIIELKSVNKWFGDFQVLKDVNLEVGLKQKIVVCGPSGSGKSTLIRCINRLEEHQQGQITVDGIELTKATKDIEKIRAEVGMVFQQFNLFPHLSVVDNCALAPIWVKKMSKKEAEELALQQLETVHISDQARKFPGQLSGGQQQRVGIARSLAVEPDIWFLDEPFSALDPLIRKEMQDEFLRLQGALKKTIMFVTHDFDEALRLADRIAIMKDGIIEQLDTPAKIVLNPATEYVKKFTEEVPREKVLKIEAVMEPMSDNKNLSDLKVSKDAIIETVAEKILSQEKPVAVTDSNKKVVGIVKPSKVIHTVFGGRKENS